MCPCSLCRAQSDSKGTYSCCLANRLPCDGLSLYGRQINAQMKYTLKSCHCCRKALTCTCTSIQAQPYAQVPFHAHTGTYSQTHTTTCTHTCSLTHTRSSTYQTYLVYYYQEVAYYQSNTTVNHSDSVSHNEMWHTSVTKSYP